LIGPSATGGGIPRLLDPPDPPHTPQDPVEVGRIHENTRSGSQLHGFDDAIAVERTLGQDREDKKVSGSEGKVFLEVHE
jgi:hypothetical protein